MLIKTESVYFDIDNFELVLKAKTPIREVVIWRVGILKTWFGREKNILDKIKKIVEDDKQAILYRTDNNHIIREFAEIKIYEFPHIKIETEKAISEDALIQTTQHASKLL